MPPINYLAVLVTGVVVFVLGGLWFSLLFTKPWRQMMGYSTAMAGLKPRALWAIESGYNLVSFIIAAVILSAWH